MATFGAGVNAQLGAINYAPYSQGVAQGSAALGRGIASLGEDFAKGIQQYQLNKKIASEATTETEALVSQNPEVLKWLANEGNTSKAAQLYKKSLKDGVLSMNDATSLNGAVRSFINEKTKQADSQMKLEKMRIDIFNADSERIRANAAKTSAERERMGGNLSDKDQLFNMQLQGFIGTMGRQPNPEELAKIAQDAYAPARMYASAEEQARTEELKAESNSAIKFLDDVTQRATNVSAAQATNNEARRLLESADTDTGFGQDWLNSGRALAQRMGIGDPTSLGNQQAMTAYLQTDQLNQAVALINGQGQVSDSERKLINKTALDASKTKGANLQILDLREAAQNRALGAEAERQRLFDEGKSSKQVAEGIKRWYSKNTVTSFLEKTDFYTRAAVNPNDPTGSIAREIAKRNKGKSP